MTRLFDPRSIATGTAIAAAASALSFVAAVFGFGDVYYASVFIPFSMLGCLALAWFSFLRDDGLVRGVAEPGRASAGPRPAEPVPVPGLGSDFGPDVHGAPGAPGGDNGPTFAPGGLDASMYAPRDGSIVERRPDGALTGRRPGTGRAALVWAAAELGALATILYSAAGLGARFGR